MLATTGSGAQSVQYFYDGNGNVVQAGGSETAVLNYSPFGKLLEKQSENAEAMDFTFSTKPVDESGLSYYGFRFYNAELGRWLSRDPIGEDGGWNIYCFVSNNSSNKFDNLGKRCTLNMAEQAKEKILVKTGSFWPIPCINDCNELSTKLQSWIINDPLANQCYSATIYRRAKIILSTEPIPPACQCRAYIQPHSVVKIIPINGNPISSPMIMDPLNKTATSVEKFEKNYPVKYRGDAGWVTTDCHNTVIEG